MLVGLWFSLGHSTVVVLLCVAVAAGSGWIHEHLAAAEGIGAIVGTAVSSTVLLLIGAVNL
jgi:high-affinity nickel-transport protein